MIGPIKISLERLAATYGIDDLGLAWIQTDVDSNRTLVLQPVPERSIVLLQEMSRSDVPYRSDPLTAAEVEAWLPKEVTG